MSRTSSTTTGLGAVEALQRELARARPIRAAVTCKATGGRSAGENVIILRTQAKQGRNVIFLDRKEFEEGQKIWTGVIDKITHGRARLTALDVGAKKVGDVLVDAIRTHVNEGRRERGRVKPLTRLSKYRKDKETGNPNLPVLVRTGALMESLTPTVSKL